MRQRQISKLRNEGKSIRAIADELGMHRSSVHREIKRLQSGGDAVGHADGTASDFVGRERELRQFESALSQVIAGNGQVVLLAGEPGIGKTRTADEYALRARKRGCEVLWSRCHDNGGAPPYWAWIQIVRSCLNTRPETADGLDGADIRNLSTIVPGLDLLIGQAVVGTQKVDWPESRFPLFESVTTMLRTASKLSPVVIVVDNLHWADDDTLLLFQFVANQIDDSRLMLVGTYRNTAPAAGGAMWTAFEDVPRGALLRQTLPRLDLEQTRVWIETTELDASTDFVDRFYSITEGNPLFMREVERMIVQRAGDGAGSHSDNSLTLQVPDGIREVVARRLSLLADGTNRMLEVASVFGREFAEVEVRHAIPRAGDDSISGALDEAAESAVISEIFGDPGCYRFTHELLKVTIYDSIPPGRRSELHRSAAQALLELHGPGPSEHAGQIARHTALSGDNCDPTEVVRRLTDAARWASTMRAFDHAATIFKEALNHTTHITSRSDRLRADLQIELAVAQRRAGRFLEARSSFRSAADSARESGRHNQLSRAALGFAEAGFYPALPGDEAVGLLREALDGPVAIDSMERALLLGSLGRSLSYTSNHIEAEAVSRQAVEMSTRSADSHTIATCLRDSIMATWFRPGLLEDRIRQATELIRLATELGDAELLSEGHGFRLFSALEAGDMETVDRDIAAKERIEAEIHSPEIRYMTRAWRSMRAAMSGNFDAAEEFTESANSIGRRLQGYATEGTYGIQMFGIRRNQGRLGEIAPVLQVIAERGSGGFWGPGLAVVYAELEMRDLAAAEFEKLAAQDFRAVPMDSLWLGGITFLAEVCAYLGDAVRARTLHDLLLPFAERNVTVGAAVASYGAVHRYLGLLAMTMETMDLAIRHFELALEFNRRIGHVPAHASTCHDLASALLTAGGAANHQRAGELLRRSASTASDLDMKLLAHKCEIAASRLTEYETAQLLTERERDVLRLIARGMSNKKIGEELYISFHTVGAHVSNILAKTGASNRAEALAYAMKYGVLDVAEPR